MNKWGRFLSVAHIPQRLKPGSFFLGFCGTAEAVPFPVVVNPPVLVDVGGNATGAESPVVFFGLFHGSGRVRGRGGPDGGRY